MPSLHRDSASVADANRSSARVQAVQKSKGTRELAENMMTNGVDHSVVRPSIDVSVTGMKQALMAAENGTPEIRQCLFDECNVVYECKVCLNLFRSLANLVSHKRSFCHLRYSQTRHRDVREYADLPANGGGDAATTATVCVVPEEPLETVPKEAEFDVRRYSPSIELLREAGIIREIENRPLFSQLRRGGGRPETTSSIEGVAQRLKRKVDSAFDADYYAAKELRLEKMRQTACAVFQTEGADGPSMGEKYAAWQNEKLLESGFLGPDGRLLEPGEDVANCSEALSDSSKENSATRKRIIKEYQCPVCRKRASYSNVNAVRRHIKRAHERTAAEANDLTQELRTVSYLAEVDAAGNVVSRKLMKEAKSCSSCGCRFQSVEALKRHAAQCGSKRQKAKVLPTGGGGKKCRVRLERLSGRRIASLSSSPPPPPKASVVPTNVGRRALSKLLSTPMKKTNYETTRRQLRLCLTSVDVKPHVSPPPPAARGESFGGDVKALNEVRMNRKRTTTSTPPPGFDVSVSLKRIGSEGGRSSRILQSSVVVPALQGRNSQASGRGRKVV